MKKICLLVLLILNTGIFAQGGSWIREHYSKKEYRVPMRDGLTLFTSVYSPKDTSQNYPFIMVRTPYTVAPYGEDNYPNTLGPNPQFAEDGFIFVFQDVRGQFMSEGKYDNMRAYIPNKKSNKDVDESSDTYDTIDWLIKNINHNNGRVGIWGISYPGFYAAMSLIDAHPALKAVSPQAPISDWFVGDDMHHNGALSLSMSFNFFKAFDQQRDGFVTTWKTIEPYDSPDMYTFFMNLGPLSNINKKYYHEKLPFWNEVLKHPNYDEFWQSRNNLPHFKNIKPAVLIVGGWYDSEDMYGPLHIYQSIEKKNPDNKNQLVMGPWFHGGWARSNGESFGDFAFGDSTSITYNKKFIQPFFDFYLKDKGEYNPAEVNTFRTGSNKWETYDKWPPANAEETDLFLSSDAKLEWTKPANKESEYSEYISDPNKPVPYTAKFYNSATYYNRSYMNEDQRFAYTRPDVLSFQTEILDTDVTFTGPITADLFVSTSGTDADWVVKIIDVYPLGEKNSELEPEKVEYGGYQRLIRFEIMRGKYRNNLEKPEPFVPGEPTEVKINLNDIDHTFLKGHRIMVQVQSSFFPFFDRNPQKFMDIYSAKESDFQKTANRVFFSKEFPSHIKFLKVN